MPYGIIYDMDGLLIDSEPLHQEAEERLFNFLGCSGREINKQTFGMKAEDALTFLKEQLGFEAGIEEAKDFWSLQIVELFSGGMQLMPGALTGLKRLKKSGFKLGLCSSSPRTLVDIVIEQFRLEKYFQAIVSGDEVAAGKPEPEIYLLCAAKLGLAPQDCLALEDSPNGVLAAKRAGMFCIAVPNCFTKDGDFGQADLILPSLEELTPELLTKIFK